MEEDNLEAMKWLQEGLHVAPKESEISFDTLHKKLVVELPGRSFTVYEIKTES